MRFALVALVLALPTVANAALIRGQVEGTSPRMEFGNWIELGTPYVLDFTIDTSTADLSVSLFIDGSDHDYMRGEGWSFWGGVAPAGSTGFLGVGTIAEDSLMRTFPFLPDAAFGIAIAIPGSFDTGVPPRQRLAGMKFSDITGVTFGFSDMDELEPVPVLFANNAKPIHVPVPEPSTFVLGLFAIAGLWAYRNRSISKTKKA